MDENYGLKTISGRSRALGASDQEIYNRVVDKYTRKGGFDDDEADCDPVEDMWRANALEDVGQTFMALREKVLKSLAKGIKTKSYYILQYFLDFRTLNKLNSPDIKYFLKWVKASINEPPSKDFLKSEPFLKLQKVFNKYAESDENVKSVLPFLLRQAGLKPPKGGQNG